ncbi:MAG: hypothetical protein A2V98_08870 [Planctomycetes bacterium RBG_16_64_12]|nr:MAG: hypothetical protein A2V98_08870 [Planctomycetes bacterium RBG_16_64_12]
MEPKILAAAERQMQAWALTQQIAERTLRVDRPAKRADQLGEFITISRESGACGSQIAALVGRKLGWEVLDKNLLDRVADRSNLSRLRLEFVDETTADWASGLFSTWLDPKSVPHHKYVVQLGRIVLATARRGNAVFVGRGAQFLLPRAQGLSVRIIAPRTYRIQEIMRRHGFSAARAGRFIDSVDRGRREFVERFFHRDINDPHLYDLVINVDRFGLETVADKIVDAYPR